MKNIWEWIVAVLTSPLATFFILLVLFMGSGVLFILAVISHRIWGWPDWFAGY